MQIISNASDAEIALSINSDELRSTSVQLGVLLVRCAELRRDLSQIYAALKRLTTRPDHSRLERSTQPFGSTASHRSAISGTGFRHALVDDRRTRSRRSALERACRIALMETNEPSSVEAIYDRIQRRGSFTFSGYKRPLRAIMLILTGLVRSGEAKLLLEDGQRRWHWQTEPVTFERPIS
jgi:hypothetical protein